VVTRPGRQKTGYATDCEEKSTIKHTNKEGENVSVAQPCTDH